MLFRRFQSTHVRAAVSDISHTSSLYVGPKRPCMGEACRYGVGKSRLHLIPSHKQGKNMHTGLPQRHGTPVPEKILRDGSSSPATRCTAHIDDHSWDIIPSSAPRDYFTDGRPHLFCWASDAGNSPLCGGRHADRTLSEYLPAHCGQREKEWDGLKMGGVCCGISLRWTRQ